MPSIEGRPHTEGSGLSPPRSTDERSQPLLRVPRDRTPADLVLEDGERSYVQLFVAPGERIECLLEARHTFLPVLHEGTTRFVARAAIACLSVHVLHAPAGDELPHERQRVTVRLRGGTVVRGELRWTAPSHSRRTLDHVNDGGAALAVYDDPYVHVVAKSAVLTIDEVTC